MSVLNEIKKQYRIETQIEQLPSVDRYTAYDLVVHRSVTLHALRNTSIILRQRLIKSVELLSKIHHPNLSPILDCGPLDGRQHYCYYWTTPQYTSLSTPSGSPAGYIKSPEKLLTTLTIILQALAVAHAAELVHHRVRWETLVSIDGQVCLLDFGVPKHRSIQEERCDTPTHSDEKVGDILRAIEMAESFASLQGKRSQMQSVDSWPDLSAFLHKLVNRVRRQEITTAADAERAISNFQHQDYPIHSQGNRNHRKIIVETALNSIGTNLPVLARTLRDAPPSNRLSETVVLHINHGLDDVFFLDRLFNDLFAKSVYVAIPYGRQHIPVNHAGVVYHAKIRTNSFELLRSGQPTGERSATFVDAMERLVTLALRDAILPELTNGRRLLIVEDGGYHYQPLRQCFEDGLLAPESVVGVVEQTMSGAIKCVAAIQNHSVSYPALTLARSDLKMRYEAFFIGRRVVDELSYLLYRHDEFLSLRRVLIIGYGIIGRSIALSLKGMACDISVIDICEDIQNVANNDGLDLIATGLSRFFTSEVVVVGATGEPSFSLSMLADFAHSQANRIFLVSASSKRVEFSEVINFFEGGEDNRENLIRENDRLSAIEYVRVEQNTSGLAYLFSCAGRNKTVVLVARGYPVNFYRKDGFSLTMGMIDPINAELVLLANHAVNSKGSLDANKLYALGWSTIPGFSITEEHVLATWRETRGLTLHEPTTGLWSGFPIHPSENYLRLRRLDDAVLVRKEIL